MSATAEFVGYDRSSTPSDYAGIITAGEELFPGAIDWDSARYRTGLRPMTPDGPPLIGLGRHDNLYYNTGHGHVGWTMACGSARMLADLIDGRRPDIDPTPYAPWQVGDTAGSRLHVFLARKRRNNSQATATLYTTPTTTIRPPGAVVAGDPKRLGRPIRRQHTEREVPRGIDEPRQARQPGDEHAECSHHCQALNLVAGHRDDQQQAHDGRQPRKQPDRDQRRN